MKVIHIHSKSDLDILPVVEKALPELGQKIAILTTVQHLARLPKVAEWLEQKGKQVVLQSRVLGCKSPDLGQADTILYVGTGKFHPRGIVVRTGREVITADPGGKVVGKVTPKELEGTIKARKGALMKFYASDTIGIILSAKSGQNFFEKKNQFKLAQDLEKKYPEKQFYYFACNTLNFQELENFPFVEVWLNAMCPRMEEDADKLPKPVVNVLDVPLENAE